jgi:mRNA interferase RelE/StbE
LVWTLEFSDAARKSLRDMDKQSARRIVTYLRDRVAVLDNPRSLGRALQGTRFENQWRYRVGDYRIISEIRNGTITIVVVSVGHRREIYR